MVGQSILRLAIPGRGDDMIEIPTGSSEASASIITRQYVGDETGPRCMSR